MGVHPPHHFRGEGVIFDPEQVLGSYICPIVATYEPTRHLQGYLAHKKEPHPRTLL